MPACSAAATRVKVVHVDGRDFLRRVRGLKVWSAGGERAPHKPLLLLLALGRLQRGDGRLARFEEIEGPLTDLLLRFGLPRKPQRPVYPFTRLCNDGLWDVPAADSVPRTASGDFKKTSLIRQEVEGGLPEAVYRLLLGNAELVANTAQLLRQSHFPESLHDDIRDAVGLRAEWVVRDTQAPARDPNFRSRVLRAYGVAAPFATTTSVSGTSCLAWRPHTSDGTRRAGRTRSATDWRCAGSITRRSIGAHGAWSRSTTDSGFSFRAMRTVRARRCGCSATITARACGRLCALPTSRWPSTFDGTAGKCFGLRR